MEQGINKEELLKQIVSLTTMVENLRIAEASETQQLSGIKTQRDILEAAAKRAKEAFEKVQVIYSQKSGNLESIGRKKKSFSQDLQDLQRRLARIQDAEEINAAYLSQLEEFRNSCLESAWRGENRDDGKYAREYQIDGAIHLAATKRVLFGDKRGLGKSCTSLITVDMLDSARVVIVSPADTMDNYIREIKMWCPKRGIVKIGKMPKGQRDFVLAQVKKMPQYVLVVNYEAWRKDWQLVEDLNALKLETFIGDEIQRAKGIDTVTNQGIQSIVLGLNICPSCVADKPILEEIDTDRYKCACGYEGFITDFCSIKNVFPMSGTPLMNKPQELFPPLRIVDPKNFKSEKNFLRDFCVKVKKPDGPNGEKHAARWQWQTGGEARIMKMIGPRYFGRTREDVGLELPESTPLEHIISNEEFKENYYKQWRAYETTKRFAQIMLSDDTKTIMQMNKAITVLLRKRQVMSWPADIKLEYHDKDGIHHEERLDVFQSIKVDKAEEIIREVNEEGERAVLFAAFTGGLTELQRRLGDRCAIYDGRTPESLRRQILLDFDPNTAPKNPRYDSILLNYKTGGEGLNLQTATDLIRLDWPWNPGQEDQSAGRIDRFGQTKKTRIHDITVEGTVDIFMKALIEEKAMMIQGFEGEATSVMQKIMDAIKNGDI